MMILTRSWSNGDGRLAKVDLESVHRVTARGKVYYYAWRGKGAPRLHAKPGTKAFVEELAEALRGRREPDTSRLTGVIASYKASHYWQKLAPTTRAAWGLWLDRIDEHFGKLTIRQFDRPQIRPDIIAWRDGWAHKPRSADMAIQVLSRLLAFAVSPKGLILTNPCIGLDQLYEVDRSSIVWAAADFARLEAIASPEVFAAARLAALTGLRRGDVLRLSWSHVGPLAIEMRTAKSGGRRTALIPLYAELRDFLDHTPRAATTVLVNSHGRPWGSGFSASWQRTIKRAGLDLHFHDLRGTAATRLYVAGFKNREIAEILGWGEDSVERLIDRYVKRDELILDRIRRLDQNTSGTSPVKRPVKRPVDK
ncbi:site-specific integrase [Zavarzinia compransoris]|uniref:tyrosine-type recombinase/integrase n=1 Tax=Zavarzinia marina TaxID=2911065 RepID=UPI001F3A292F|nr:site-specific integrase [Zavarzinia marina]MCF4166380.1 site-specific integrase [Zavarzinia marina]